MGVWACGPVCLCACVESPAWLCSAGLGLLGKWRDSPRVPIGFGISGTKWKRFCSSTVHNRHSGHSDLLDPSSTAGRRLPLTGAVENGLGAAGWQAGSLSSCSAAAAAPQLWRHNENPHRLVPAAWRARLPSPHPVISFVLLPRVGDRLTAWRHGELSRRRDRIMPASRRASCIDTAGP